MTIHVVLFELLGWFVLFYFGNNWLTWLAAAVCLASAQAQAGWLQHDFGHLSVFYKDSNWNHIVHHFVIGFLKGASSSWWNHRHFLHHSKPNVIAKDPDISFPMMFLFGKTAPIVWAQKKRGFLPYHKQHLYWHLLGPPTTLTIYFHVEIILFVILKKKWVDILMIVLYMTRFMLLFTPVTGGFWGAISLYFMARLLESHWFMWVTQMNHIPMKVDVDSRDNWVSLQVQATCNVEGGYFNDWFSGHLNYQIEHHLFPTMPRHNLYKIAPRTRDLCLRHGLDYPVKPLWVAFTDIVDSLRESGQLWYNAYYHL